MPPQLSFGSLRSLCLISRMCRIFFGDWQGDSLEYVSLEWQTALAFIFGALLQRPWTSKQSKRVYPAVASVWVSVSDRCILQQGARFAESCTVIIGLMFTSSAGRWYGLCLSLKIWDHIVETYCSKWNWKKWQFSITSFFSALLFQKSKYDKQIKIK